MSGARGGTDGIIGVLNLSYQSPYQDIILRSDDDPKKVLDSMIELLEDNLKRLRLLKSLNIEKINAINIHFSNEEDYQTAYNGIAIDEYIEEDDLDNVSIDLSEEEFKLDDKFHQLCLKLVGARSDSSLLDIDSDSDDGMFDIKKNT